MKKRLIKDENTTTFRIDLELFRDFRMICLSEGKKASDVAEALIQAYIREKAYAASKHLEEISKRKVKVAII